MTRKPRSHVKILIYRTWPNTESRLCASRFCSQVKSDILHSDENFVTITLVAFSSLAVTKLPWVPEVFFSLGATELSSEAPKACRKAARK